MRTTFRFIILAAFVAAAGCKSSSTSPNGSGMSIATPNVGSYFISDNTMIDSTGAITSEDTDIATVLRTNLSIYGMTGVIVILDSDYQQGIAPDTTYLKFESNGDVELFQGANSNSPQPDSWLRIPFGSQATVPWFTIDTSFQPGQRSSIVATLSGAGTGSFSIKGQTIATEKVQVNTIEKDTTINPFPSVYSYNLTISESFAPSIGYIVMTNQPGIREYAGAPIDQTSHTQLIAYHLQ